MSANYQDGDKVYQYSDEGLEKHGDEPKEDTSEESNEGADSLRDYDDDILNEIENEGCMIVQTSEYEDFLPGMFDFKMVPQKVYKNCYLCEVEFKKFKKKSFQCKRCGQSVCDPCSRNMVRLSQMDKKAYKVCDMCEHEMLNIQIIRNMDQEKEEWKKQSKMELNIVKKKIQIYTQKEQTYRDYLGDEVLKAQEFEAKHAQVAKLEKQTNELLQQRNDLMSENKYYLGQIQDMKDQKEIQRMEINREEQIKWENESVILDLEMQLKYANHEHQLKHENIKGLEMLDDKLTPLKEQDMESYEMDSSREGDHPMKSSPQTLARDQKNAFNQEQKIIKEGTWQQQNGTDTPPEDSDLQPSENNYENEVENLKEERYNKISKSNKNKGRKERYSQQEESKKIENIS